MAAKSKLTEYVILPARGITAGADNLSAHSFLMSLNQTLTGAGAKSFTMTAAMGTAPQLKVLDSIHESGAKLVQATSDSLVRIRANQTGIRIVPVRYYRQMTNVKSVVHSATAAKTATAKSITIRVVGEGGTTGVKGVHVVAFTDFANKFGAEGDSNSKGDVSLALGATTKKIERLYLYPKSGFWPGLRMAITLKAGLQVPLTPINLSFTDCLRFFYGTGALTEGHGVTVGVIDSGVASRDDLVVDGGKNTVKGEKSTDFGDNGTEGHGTHVAGIIAARGTPPAGVRGVAPGVALRSYRVFGKGADRASSFDIAKAIDAAAEDGCDIINMSLGQPEPDELMTEAIASARAKGVLVFAANGNDGEASVSFPATDDLCLAVSASGRKGTFPAGSEPEGSVTSVLGTDKKNFLADFSNTGSDTDLTGPGVGVISTVPDGHGVMSGTSMACPAEAGAAARLLATMAALVAMPRNQARSDAMAAAVLAKASKLGFGALKEGMGLIQP